MKIRTDFVSNSSSSSYIIAILSEDTYKFKDFVKDIVKSCSASRNKDCAMTKEEIAELNAFNTRNLNYHLNASELLFLGSLKLDDKTYTANHPSTTDKNYNSKEEYDYDLELFEDLQKDIKKKSFGKITGEKVVEATSTSITVSYPRWVQGIAVSSTSMDSLTGHYCFGGSIKGTKAEKIEAGKRIIELMNMIEDTKHNWLYDFIDTDTYFISKKTIWNTRALLACHAKMSFEKWEDLNALEKRLDEGQRIFSIRQNQSGDGWDNNAIYALGGWNATINKNAQVEVLQSECG